MANGALNADRPQRALSVEEAGHTNDRLQLEQRQCDRWIIEIDLASLQLVNQAGRQRVHVDFEAKGERILRAEARPDPAEIGALDCLMQVQLITPVGLIAERVET